MQNNGKGENVNRHGIKPRPQNSRVDRLDSQRTKIRESLDLEFRPTSSGPWQAELLQMIYKHYKLRQHRLGTAGVAGVARVCACRMSVTLRVSRNFPCASGAVDRPLTPGGGSCAQRVGMPPGNPLFKDAILDATHPAPGPCAVNEGGIGVIWPWAILAPRCQRFSLLRWIEFPTVHRSITLR